MSTATAAPPRKAAVPRVRQTKLLINGEWCDAASGKTFATVNPVTEDKIADVAPSVIASGRPVAVLDAAGTPVGAPRPQAVIDTLIGKDARA